MLDYSLFIEIDRQRAEKLNQLLHQGA